MSSLPDDILWEIFSENVPIYLLSSNSEPCNNAGFLTTSRSISQVCRSWRQVILSSPHVWSKTIDLSVLDLYRQPITWLMTALERANGQQLQVFGSVSRVQGLSAFVWVVAGYWTQIQVIDVEFSIDACGSNYDFIKHPAWSTISDQVSPVLQYFNMSAGRSFLRPPNHGTPNVPYIPSHQRECLLLNQQNPKVQVLSVTRVFHIPLEPFSPLFQNLRVLSIASPAADQFANATFPCEVGDFLLALGHARLLEHLTIEECVLFGATDLQQYEKRPQLQLPFLQHVELTSSLKVCTAFLLHVVPATTYNLKMRCRIDPSYNSETHIDIFYRSFRHQYAKHANLAVDSYVFVDTVHPLFSYGPKSGKGHHFRLAMLTSPFNDDHLESCRLLESLVEEEFDFSAVSVLQLQFRSFEVIDNIAPTLLRALFDKFTRVKQFIMYWEYFHHIHSKIHALPGFSGTILPNLEELVITSAGYLAGGSQSPVSDMIVFCQSRRQAESSGAIAFKRLRLPWKDSDHRWRDFFQAIPFDGLDGLEIAYPTSGRSRCGVIREGVLINVVEEDFD